MKSSSAKYFIGLDHIRALAALMVFTWHFIHIGDGHVAGPPTFPLSLFTEGHTGVALFMTLSGYLFAKLLDGKQILYPAFLWNRFIRLAPLFIVVVVVVGLQKYIAGGSPIYYAQQIAKGVITGSSLPNGGWSIIVECHFYVILPALLLLTRRWKYSLLVSLLIAMVVRGLIHHYVGYVQHFSYWTILGRIDQFMLGIVVYQCRAYFSGKHLLAVMGLGAFAAYYWYFDSLGGYFMNPSYPSPSSLWIVMPAIEGAAYALLIAWYDNSFEHSTGRMSRWLAAIGTYSFSIYLTHFFYVFALSQFIHVYIVDLSNIHMALLFAVLCFPLSIPLAYLTYRFVELPFLKYRTRYVRAEPEKSVVPS